MEVLLGVRDDVVHLALLHPGPPDNDPERPGTGEPAAWRTLRDVVASLAEDDAVLVVHALALAEWHRSHRYCPRCGSAVVPGQAGHVLRCPGCGRHHFPRTDPAVIMVVTDGEGELERCLLGRHPQWPEGRYSTLAGFVEPGESMEDAVRREVAEETSVRVGEVRYFGNQPWPFPASLMLGFTARAESSEVMVDGVEIEHARWFTRAEMRAETEAGTLVLPGGISISRSLIEAWYGEPLAGHW